MQRAAAAAIAAGHTQYTQANGLLELRERIAGWYATRFGLAIDPARIVVTAGASAALQLVCLALFEPGDEVLMPDPSYPCNRQFVAAAGATARLVATDAASRFQLDTDAVRAHWTAATRGVLLASPSNPTGTSLAPEVLAGIVGAVRERGGVTVIDEIYLGLSYDERFGHSALALGDDVISVNSFSKYFSMTGWRLGWVVLPPALVGPVETLAQHLFICPSTLAQRAALACFEPESLAEYERRRAAFRARRDVVVPALNRIGLTVPVVPDGAFYAWADCFVARREQLGLLLRDDAPGPRRADSRPRLRPGHRRAPPAAVVRQLAGHAGVGDRSARPRAGARLSGRRPRRNAAGKQPSQGVNRTAKTRLFEALPAAPARKLLGWASTSSPAATRPMGRPANSPPRCCRCRRRGPSTGRPRRAPKPSKRCRPAPTACRPN